ncbi:Flp pilus assembly complex ATPase component TadA [Balneolaceae bacterium YR4-1]|uniref:Flp pilus assembly complex ATPase component TadA n=1 Tax=Halalkalibaculum roseum TaxID=2709311 RepID=A0A6M1SMU9_9BACT|nr:ATPase, T2SS/T4P/T4SS family [Halalkalibaculum roseum]NGP76369.1 Flp pilus assembly complex ATPase component TadA [Halalkalibaculum roseum]
MGKVNTRRHIGDILVNRDIISAGELQTALAILREEPESTNRRLGQILYQDLGLDRHKIMKEIASIYAFDEVLVNVDKVDQGIIDEIKNNIDDLPHEAVDSLVHQKAIPFRSNGNSLTIAAADPSDPTLTNIISGLNFKHYELVYCKYDLVEQILTQVYEQKNEFLDLLDEIDYEDPDFEETDEKIDEDEIDAEINQSMLNSLVEGMLVEAVRQGVSDVHIVPSGPTTTDIRFRIDGKLDLWYQQQNVKPEAISAVVKDKTRNVDRFERDASQDGFIQRQVDNHSIRYRVSIMPMVGKQFDRKFESIVIRVLDDRKVITDLNVLGLQEKAKADFVKAIEKPSGIVIITGPTGSGKSTTLVAALYYVIDPSVNVLTVEEPVEYLIEGARQLKLSHHMTFDQAMRGILRHDPDIVLVGEIRDLKTAEIAIKLANTGHLTFSTLHTNDAPSAVSRLYKMGVEPFLIANAVNIIMAQRLVRSLCKNCKEEYEPHPEVAKGIGFTEEEIQETTFYKAVGCDKCTNGYKGRTAIMEALYFDKEIRKMILESGSEIDEARIKEHAISQGMLSLRASGRERIKNGTTTIEEIVAITIED